MNNGVRGSLCLSVFDDCLFRKKPIFNKARECGVMGYILKDSASTDIQLALDAVVAGDCFISPKVAGFMMKRSKVADASSVIVTMIASLTGAEREVMVRIARGLSTRQIADELHNSPRTIGNRRVNICQKLDLHGALILVRFAVENRMLLEETVGSGNEKDSSSY